MPNVLFPYRTALVTGASSGIGEALCHALSSAGCDEVVLVARRTSELERVAASLQCTSRIIVADLSTAAGLQAVIENAGTVDLLVNNAGFGSFGRFHELDPEAELQILAVNCKAPLALSAHFLPLMVREGHGCIANIASGMSFQPMPYMSTYAASKAFLLHWAEGVSEELRGTGVRMVTVCPGTIPTNFSNASQVPVDQILGVQLVSGTVSGVVAATLKGIQHNRAVTVPGFLHRMVNWSGALSPRWLIRRVMGWAMARTARRLNG
jgi:short-subunit dehydrogenase